MKKTFKRAGVAVLSMAMLLSMGAVGLTANAAEQVTVSSIKTYNTTAKNKTEVVTDTAAVVNIYQIAIFNDTTNKWVWSDGFNTGDFPVDTIKAKSAKELLAWAKTLNTTGKTVVGTGTTNNSAITLKNTGSIQVEGKNAYYLVVTTSANSDVMIAPSVVQLNGTAGDASATIDPKTTLIPLDKKIKSIPAGSGDLATDGQSAAVKIGTVVTYEIDSQLPTYDASVDDSMITPFVIVDTPDTTIDLDTDTTTIASSYKVTVTDGTTPTVLFENGRVTAGGTKTNHKGTLTDDTDDTTETVTVAYDSTNKKFTVTLPSSVVHAYKGQEITVEFNATVNATANTGATANNNTASLTYGNDYSTGGGSLTKTDTVPVYAGKIKLEKYGIDANGTVGTTKLDGAEFDLYKVTANKGLETETSTKVNTASLIATNGDLEFGYLPAGDYKLVETKAPANHKLISDAYYFTITTQTDTTSNQYDEYLVTPGTAITTTIGSATPTLVTMTTGQGTNNNEALITVADPIADSLPGTGGIGTTLFTVGGAAVVLVAGFMFVMYMKKRGTEEE